MGLGSLLTTLQENPFKINDFPYSSDGIESIALIMVHQMKLSKRPTS